jgi:hypothetical protein
LLQQFESASLRPKLGHPEAREEISDEPVGGRHEESFACSGFCGPHRYRRAIATTGP